MIVRVLSTAYEISAFRHHAINLRRIFVFSARTRPTRQAVAVVGRFQSRCIFRVTKGSRTILVVSIPDGFTRTNVMSNFRRKIPVVRRMHTIFRRPFCDLGVALRKDVRRAPRFQQVLIRRVNALLGHRSNEAMATLVNNVTKDLIKGWVCIRLLLRHVFRRVSSVTIVNREGQTALIRNLSDRQRNFFREVYGISRPTLNVTNFSTKDVRLNGSYHHPYRLNDFKLHATRTSRAKEGGRTSTRVTVLQGTRFRATYVRRHVRHTIRSALQASMRPTTNDRLPMINGTRLRDNIPILLVVVRPRRRHVNGSSAKHLKLKLRGPRQVSTFSSRYLFTHRRFRMLLSRPMLRPILTSLSHLAVNGWFVQVGNSIRAGVVIGRRLRYLTFGTIPLMFISKFHFRITLQTMTMTVSASAYARFFRRLQDRNFIRLFKSMTRDILRYHDHLHENGNMTAIKYPPSALSGKEVKERYFAWNCLRILWELEVCGISTRGNCVYHGVRVGPSVHGKVPKLFVF